MTPEERTYAWSEKLIRAGAQVGLLPVFGSAEWWQLEAGDLRRQASIVRAAEAWRRHCSPETVVQDEVELGRLVDDLLAERVRNAMWDARHSREDWHNLLRDTRTFAELQQARGVAA